MKKQDVLELKFSIYKTVPDQPKKNFDRTFFMVKHTISDPFPLHWHNWLEIEFVTKGSGRHIIDTKEYEISTGSIYLLPPTSVHEIIPYGDIEVITYSFDYTFIPTSIFPFLTKLHKPIVSKLSAKSLEKFIGISNYLYEEFLGESAFKSENIASYFSILMIEFFIESGFAKSDDESLLSPKRQIAKILNYIQEHYSDNPSLPEIAKAFYYDPAYFSKFFKKHMGMTYKNYLNETKISNAKKLLLENKLSIIDIALSCGFNSKSNFSNAFKKSMGQSPTDFISSIK